MIFALIMSSLIYIGSGNGNSAQSQQFFDRLVTPPTGIREALYGQLIDGLVTDGIWAKLDGLCVFASADNQTGFTNLISSSFQSRWPQNTGTFTVDAGATPLGSATNLGANFIPSSQGVNYQLNSACVFSWNLGTSATNNPVIGLTNTVIYPHFGDINTGNTNFAVNGSLQDIGSSAASLSGFWLANRTSSNSMTLDRNGVQIATSSNSSLSMDSSEWSISSNNTNQIAAWGFGGSLTSGQRLILYTRLYNYLHAIGAV